jgi:ubiquinone/menaquinone biosynthesis C-methylase UbiE
MCSSRWEEVAEEYNRIFRKDQVEGGDDWKILDLGCGTGNLTSLLRERFPTCKVCGVDPADKMLRLASDRFRDDPEVEILKGDGTRIPFLSGHFDYVVSNLALHHVLPELRPLCAVEIARVLKAGGRLVYSDLFWDVPGEREDAARCRDIIDKIVAYALYNLEIGAYEMTLFLFEQLPLHLSEKDEYVTILEDWLEPLREAGFGEPDVIIPPHPEFAFKIIRGVKNED